LTLRLVFIHLGEAKADHLWANIENILQSSSDYKIDVITSKPLDDAPSDNPRLSFYVYHSDIFLSSVLDKATIDPKFRSGFWRFSLERLFALTAHHQNYPAASLLHIESDILLLPNFPFHIFDKLEKPAWLKQDKDRDIAAILYIPNIGKSNWLLKKMLQEIEGKKQINDMLLLSAISTKFPESVTILPSISQQDSGLINKSYQMSSKIKSQISSNFATFDGIFDPAALGIWLTGNDPRNAFGVTRKFDTHSLLNGGTFVDPSKTIFSFSESEGLTVLDNGKRVRIYNLHVHSKNQKLFKNGWEKVLLKIVEASGKSRIKRTFSLRILLQLVNANHKNGTLLRFLSWLPFVAPLRKFGAKFKNL